VQYESVAAQVKNPDVLAAFYAGLATSQYQLALFDQVISNATKAAELSETCGNAEDAALAYAYWALGHVQKGELEQGLRIAQKSLRKVEQKFNLAIYSRALTATSFAYSALGRWQEAVRTGERALEVAQQYSDYALLCQAGYCLALAHLHRGDLPRAVECGELGVQKAPTPAFRVFSEVFLAWAWCRVGDAKRAIVILESILQVLRAGQNRLGELMCVRVLTEGYLLAGEKDKALESGRELLEMATQHGTSIYLCWAYRLLGEIWMTDNIAQSQRHFEEAISIMKEMKTESELALVYANMGRLHKQQGEVEQARKFLTDALEIFERLGTLIEPDRVRKELAELPTSV
jgi:tetratricopeptide (TPR) repeat protein